MAIIPNGQKFHTVSADVDTDDKGSARSNSDREVYTMQDIIDTAGGGGGPSDICRAPAGALQISPLVPQGKLRVS